MTNMEAAEEFVIWCHSTKKIKRAGNGREWFTGAVFAVLSWKSPDTYEQELRAVQEMCGLNLPKGSAEKLRELQAQVTGPESTT